MSIKNRTLQKPKTPPILINNPQSVQVKHMLIGCSTGNITNISSVAFTNIFSKMGQKFLLILLAVLICGSAVTGTFRQVSNFTGGPEQELDYHRLVNILYPFKDHIRSFWTRRPSITQAAPQDFLTCQLCNLAMPLMKNWVIDDNSTKLVQAVATEVCKTLKLSPRPETTCKIMIEQYTDQLLYVVQKSPPIGEVNVTDPSTQICGLLVPDCGKPLLEYWPLNLHGPKPPPINREIVNVSAETTKIIQFTDLHVDLDYMEGTSTDCDEGVQICCRLEDGFPPIEEDRAGPYGAFRCGLPYKSLRAIYEHAKDNVPDARYIFLTGDYIHSGLWLYNEHENSRHVRNVTGTLAEVFPDPKMRIYPVVGNHEPQLINQFPPTNLWGEPGFGFNISWVYRDVLEPFIKRDPTFLEEAEIERFHQAGYYSARPEAGLRIIFLNTNLCQQQNFWLGYNDYPVVREQLQWMADELKDAEYEQDSVLIVGHVEPGECWPIWSGKFNEVVDRFAGIIRGSFFGHSHKPQYRISMSNGTMNPVFASYIAGSGVPDLMQPSYSVFHVDGERQGNSMWDVIRQEMIILNLTETNRLNVPTFEKLTDSYEMFGMVNLGPNSILELAQNLICNQTLVDRYLKFHNKGEDAADYSECQVTDKVCMRNILCTIVSSNAADQHACMELEKIINDTACDS